MNFMVHYKNKQWYAMKRIEAVRCNLLLISVDLFIYFIVYIHVKCVTWFKGVDYQI